MGLAVLNSAPAGAGERTNIDPANDSAEFIPAHLIKSTRRLFVSGGEVNLARRRFLIGATSVVGGAGVVGAARPRSPRVLATQCEG